MVTNFQHNINKLLLAIKEKQSIKQTIKQINTGANIYTVIADYDSIKNQVNYYVNKRNKNGKDLGTLHIDSVSYYGISYNAELFSIPDSVKKVIHKHYTTISKSVNK